VVRQEWSWAFDTPFDWFKQNASRLGGTGQNMVVQWPNRIKDKGGLRDQFMHVIDHVPTILEATGIPAPEYVDGIKQNPIEGTSYAYRIAGQIDSAQQRKRHSWTKTYSYILAGSSPFCSPSISFFICTSRSSEVWS
jgi:arylsulfatase A-like enzyme